MFYNCNMANNCLLRMSVLSLGAMLFLGACADLQTPEYHSTASSTSASDTRTAGKTTSSPDHPGLEIATATPVTFDWPVDHARMTRGFLPNKRHPHLGIDLAAPKGTPVLAAQDGTVIYTGREFRGYGKMIIIESAGGWATLYAHFDKIIASEGQKVHKGEIIGAMGRTGHATGYHLHFEIRKDRGPVDPLPLLPRTATAGM